MVYDIGPGVPTADVTAIRDAIPRGKSYLREVLGADPVATVTLRVFGGDGATTPRVVGAQIRIDTNNVGWASQTAWKKGQTAIHEYTHVWQAAVGCGDRPPVWFIEGMANMVGFEALLRDGIIASDEVVGNRIGGTRASPLTVTLKSLETAAFYDAGGYPYSIAHLAVSRLVTRSNMAALRAFCQSVSSAASWQTAFQAVFGLTADQFYADFESFRRTL